MTEPDTAQLVVDLRATDDAVRANGWVAPGLGVPGAPLGLLNTALNPLGGLAAAGLGWFMPLVSFLGDGLTQLQGGNGSSVMSGSRDFGDAGQDLAGVADTYRQTTSAQTSDWSGTAATEYRDTGARHADGIAGLGQASTMTGSAIIGAGQVVAQAIAEVTELIAEAVAEIVPIMTQAIARAGETFGQSVVEAIPPCVGIAVTYALRIAAKLAALVASGDNLMKLVRGGMAIVDLINQGMSHIGRQSVRPDAEPQTTAAAGPSQGSATASEVDAAVADQAQSPPGSPSSGGSSPLGGAPVSAPPPVAGSRDATYSSGALPTMPDPSRFPATTGAGAVSPGPVPTGGVSTGAVPSGSAYPGGVPLAAGPGSGTRAERGTTTRQETRQATTTKPGGTLGGVPMGGMAGARQGDQDKEHKRKYTIVENHEETFETAPPVIPIIKK